jgi:hypothetical protein
MMGLSRGRAAGKGSPGTRCLELRPPTGGENDGKLSLQTLPTAVYGIGVDIGATTIVAALIDLLTGQILDRVSMINFKE